MKSRILLVVDSENWAFGNIAKQLKMKLNNYFDIDIITLKMFNDNIVKVLILSKRYDLVHFFWREHINCLTTSFAKDYIEKIGFKYNEFIKKYVEQNIITTSVYDHLFLDDKNYEITKFVLNNVKNYTVSSLKLKEIYYSLDDIKKPQCVIQDGVDIEKFKSSNLQRFKDLKNRVINIGWVGNSKFTDTESDDDLKGLRKIIMPALMELKNEGYNINEKFADRNKEFIPHDKMPEYYNDIDIYVCASKTEGTPNPVLESMACGVPVISTNVGIVFEVFGEKQKEFILEERSVNCLKNKIKYLISKPEFFKELSEENLKQIQNWTWNKQAMKFKDFFEKNI